MSDSRGVGWDTNMTLGSPTSRTSIRWKSSRRDPTPRRVHPSGSAPEYSGSLFGSFRSDSASILASLVGGELLARCDAPSTHDDDAPSSRFQYIASPHPPPTREEEDEEEDEAKDDEFSMAAMR